MSQTELKTRKHMARAKYKEEYILKAYELRRVGYSKNKVAQCLGVTRQALQYWYNTKPLFKKAIIRGRKLYKASQQNNSMHYIVKHLPKDVQKQFKKIIKAQKNKASFEQIKVLCKEKGEHTHQILYLHQLIRTNFKITKALEYSGVSFYKYDQWLQDPKFKKLQKEIEWHRGNFYEDAIGDLVRVRDAQIVKWVNETYNADRGYGKQSHIKIDQEVTTQQFDFSEMPLELQRELLQWHRNRKQVDSIIVEEQTAVSQKQLPVVKKKRKKKKVRSKNV